MYKAQTLYFHGKGEANTDEALKSAKERADQLGIRDIVVATTGGETGLKAAETFRGYNVIVVTHVAGMKEVGTQEVNAETTKKITAAGGKIVTTANTFSGVNAAIQKKFNTVYRGHNRTDATPVRAGHEGVRGGYGDGYGCRARSLTSLFTLFI